MRRSALRATVLGTLVLGLASACAQDGLDSATTDEPRKKKRTILLSTEYDDLAVGEEAAQSIEAEMGIYDSPELTRYVAKIGHRLAQHAAPRPFQYQFQIVDQMSPNAFSLPGGLIYVSRGLIALAQNDDELANVLGHEIIHASDRHAAAWQELSRRTNPFTIWFLRMAKLAAYSRDHERAADRGGQLLAAKAGYDPAGMASFLKHLANTQRLAVGYSRLTSYLDTHPNTTERVASTAARADTLDWSRDSTRRTGRSLYLQNIEGLLLGTNPAEGLFRGTEFIHADLDFRILFPHGWSLVNTHSQVGAISPDGYARIFITLEAAKQPEEKHEKEAGPESAAPSNTAGDPPEILTPEQAANRMVENPADKFEIRVLRAQPVQIGEIQAYRLDIEGRMEEDPIIGQINFIAHNRLVFRLTSVATNSAWSHYQGRIHSSARTFRPLTDEERDSVEVLHLGFVHALEGEDVSTLSERSGNVWSPGRTAVLNGVFVDTRFRAGQLVKIARPSAYATSERESQALPSAKNSEPIGPERTPGPR
jgi:predicted Zn-dependent protease